MLIGSCFEESLVKVVSLNFFCSWESLKKTMLGLWQFGRYQVGQAAQ